MCSQCFRRVKSLLQSCEETRRWTRPSPYWRTSTIFWENGKRKMLSTTGPVCLPLEYCHAVRVIDQFYSSDAGSSPWCILGNVLSDDIYIYVDELYQVPPKRITVVLFRIELQDAHDVENLTTRPDHVIQILPAGNRIWLLVCSFHPAMRVFYLLTFLAVLVTTALACVSYTLIQYACWWCV